MGYVAGLAVAALLCAEIPEGGVEMLPGESGSVLRLVGSGGASFERMDVEGMPFTRSIRVVTEVVPANPWGFQIMGTTTGEVRNGDVILMSLYARGSAARNENGSARAVAYLQQAQAPNTKLGTLAMDIGPEWRQFLMPFRAAMNLSSGQHNFTIFLGYYAQTVEVGGVRLVNYGTSKAISELPRTRIEYGGRAADAPWRAEAAERIERYRKAELTVRVRDPGARVRVRMLRHAFGFGSAVVARHIVSEGFDPDRYRWVIAEYFNKVVFENDLKWPPWEVSKSNTNGSYRQVWTDAALAWLAERRIAVRGHFLSWGATDSSNGVGPGSFPMETVPQRLLAHIDEKAPAVGDRVVEWDTINHPVASWATTLEQRFGRELYVDIFRRSRAAAPASVAHWINEGNIAAGGGSRDRYEEVIRYLIEQGQAPDGIGMMGHFSEGALNGMEDVWRTFERFAALVPNLQLTELDVDTTDEQLQADYLRDVMTLAFSHPAFSGIVMWGFWEGAHWKPEAALWRRDWSLKPAGQAWLDLVRRQWWTEAEVAADEEGVAKVRGFLGSYEVMVESGGVTERREVVLGREGVEVVFE